MKRGLIGAAVLAAVAMMSQGAHAQAAYQLKIKGMILQQTCTPVASTLNYTLPTTYGSALASGPGATTPIDIHLKNCPKIPKYETQTFSVKAVFADDGGSIDTGTGMLRTRSSTGTYDPAYPLVELLNASNGQRVDLMNNTNLPSGQLKQKGDSSDVILSYQARFAQGALPVGEVFTSVTFTLAYD